MSKVSKAALISWLLLCAAARHAPGYRQIYAFGGGADATAPAAALLELGGIFVGTSCKGGANGHGTVYSVTANGQEHVLYSFAAQGDGVCPTGGLLRVGNKLYGTTQYGGAFNFGTVFSIKLLPGVFGTPTIVHSFANQGDGRLPLGGLALLDNTVYGTTGYGGSSTNCNHGGCGTVFFITRHDFFATLYSFQGNSDGAIPKGALLPVGNVLYGTTGAGGTGGPCGSEGAEILGCGTVFSITPRGQEKVIYAFQGGLTDGAHPTSGLVKDGIWLYGTTYYGGGGGGPDHCNLEGSSGCGTVFGVTQGGTERVLHMFGDTNDGVWPVAGLTLLNGVLYGTTTAETNLTVYGGTVFSITPIGYEKIVYPFVGNGGTSAAAPLTAASGKLFGTTQSGGSSACSGGCGTVFELTP